MHLNNAQKFALTFNIIFFIKDLGSQVFLLKDIHKELIFPCVLACEFWHFLKLLKRSMYSTLIIRQ